MTDKQPGLGSTELGFGEEEWRVKIYTDTTVTEVEVIPPGTDDIGYGVARRRKGDKRKDSVGIALATARALEDTASKLRAYADDVFEGRARA